MKVDFGAPGLVPGLGKTCRALDPQIDRFLDVLGVHGLKRLAVKTVIRISI